MHYWNLGELDECERYLKKSATRAERGFKHFYNPFLQLAVLYQTRAKEMLKKVDEMIGIEGHPMKQMAQRNIHVLGQITPAPAVLGRDGLEMKRAREIADAIRRKG
jgi:hypothetical protein